MTDPHAFDLSLFVPPGLAVEVRGMDVGRPGLVVAGYVGPDCPPKVLAAHCRREYAREGQPPPSGIYFTPHGRTIPAGMNPKPGAWTAARRPLTEDGDVPARRFLFVDVDRRKTPDTMHLSATGDEKAAAGELAGRVLDTMTGLGWSDPLKVDSGNGYHLYYRLSTPQPGGPAADPLADPLAILLRLLGEQLNTDAAEIDTRVFNSSRIMKVPGTWARKGPNTPDRPHRVCRVLNVPDGWNPGECDPAADVLRAVESLDPGGVIRAGWRVSSSSAATGPVTGFPRTGAGDRLTDRATAYVRSLPPSIQGANGSAKLYAAATALVHGFDLPTSTARDILHTHFNPRCEPAWSDAEIDRKLSEAATKDHREPRGWLRDRDQGTGIPEAPAYLPDYCGPVSATSTPPTPPGDVPPAGPVASSPPPFDPRVNEASDSPQRLARILLARFRRLVYWRNEFHVYQTSGYDAREKDDFDGELNSAIYRQLALEHRGIEEAAKQKDPAATVPPLKGVPPQLVAGVSRALVGYCRVPGLDDAPAWLGGSRGRPNPLEIVSVANGLVHMPTYAAGDAAGLTPHTPDYFAPPGTGYRVGRSAAVPARWLAFLAETWPDDPESIGLLQEWFGYLLSPDTRKQKMLMLVGQSGGGKGTILKVLTALVGHRNVANPNLHDFGSNFGLSGLLGKSIAVVGDAQSNGLGHTAGIVVQNLLKISAEDPVMIDRKNKPLLQAKLSCRLVFASNEVIRLPNTAGAFARRWSVLRFDRKPAAPDETLADQLTTDAALSGIFNWAAEGWARLQRQRQFTETASGRAVTADLVTAGSPVAEFVLDRCRQGDEQKVGRDELYAAWRKWCDENDQRPGSKNQFGQRLRAYLPQVTDSRPRVEGERQWVYVGISLLPEIPGYSPPDDRLAHETREPEPVPTKTLADDL